MSHSISTLSFEIVVDTNVIMAPAILQCTSQKESRENTPLPQSMIANLASASHLPVYRDSNHGLSSCTINRLTSYTEPASTSLNLLYTLVIEGPDLSLSLSLCLSLCLYVSLCLACGLSVEASEFVRRV